MKIQKPSTFSLVSATKPYPLSVRKLHLISKLHLCKPQLPAIGSCYALVNRDDKLPAIKHF